MVRARHFHAISIKRRDQGGDAGTRAGPGRKYDNPGWPKTWNSPLREVSPQPIRKVVRVGFASAL